MALRAILNGARKLANPLVRRIPIVRNKYSIAPCRHLTNTTNLPKKGQKDSKTNTNPFYIGVGVTTALLTINYLVQKENERKEIERKEKERKEFEQKENERKEKEQKENEKIEFERKENEKIEFERKENERKIIEQKEIQIMFEKEIDSTIDFKEHQFINTTYVYNDIIDDSDVMVYYLLDDEDEDNYDDFDDYEDGEDDEEDEEDDEDEDDEDDEEDDEDEDDEDEDEDEDDEDEDEDDE
ncbi:MAG: hypothetical protein Edafosvirus8_8 [Edafosvirus sp.]|uniref:Uncharacterized protein n=1 Tax=Edafosvirus sp. TaxID=2487765 RepID=A0A3G4ZTN7_9VIRU|nr:MAG: hypothetical protein Edafosvirus8_8 [Edafosvirus sp.]